MRGAAESESAEVLVAYGANRTGSAVPWLTTWPVTREAVFVLPREGTGCLLVGFDNHVPNARDMVARSGLEDEVSGMRGDAATALAATLERLVGAGRPAATVGALPGPLRAALDGWATRVVDLTPAYTRMRMVKSEQELRWLEHAAVLTDRAAAALLDAAANGASERELVAAAEHAYRAAGGSHHICYVSTTAMEAPDRCVPAQWPSDRRVRAGSAVVFELSAGWGADYPAQLLRTVAVGTPPTPLFARLQAVAEGVRDDLLARVKPGALPVDLSAVLERVRAEGLTTVDHLVHGLGGGYLPPVLGEHTGTPQGPHAEPLRAGTTLVVQPNICTPDLRAGVQTGEMVVVTDSGYRSLHRFPPGLLSVPYHQEAW